MTRFATKIVLDDTLKELFFSFLLNGKYDVPTLSKKQEELILHISEQFLFSGFILTSCSFNSCHDSLLAKLRHQRRSQLMRQMRMANDLHNVAREFNDKKIEFVTLKGWALNSDGIYQPGLRMSRDIDLLVKESMLDEAYKVLRSLGYKYMNNRAEDSSKYRYGNHLPSMTNENNTKLDLHFRVIHSKYLKKCPLAESMLMNKRISIKMPQIYCPTIEATLSHIVHHGVIDHRMNMGPIFLFDLAAIFLFCKKKWPIDTSSLKGLGVYDDFNFCTQIIEKFDHEQNFSRESHGLINQIFTGSSWLQINYCENLPQSLLETNLVEHFEKVDPFRESLIKKIRNMKCSYQVSYFSLKFYFLLGFHGLKWFNKRLRMLL